MRVEKYSSNSLDTFSGFDFVTNQTFQNAGRMKNNDNIFLSMTHGIDDPKLIAKVRKYSGVPA